MGKDARTKGPWELGVRSGLKKRSEETGKSMNQILRDGGFKESTFAGVRDANRIAAQSEKRGGEIYAYLYLVHDIQQADPRTIPPRKSVGGLIKRAWSNKRLEEFKAKLEKSGKLQALPATDALGLANVDQKVITAFRALIRQEVRNFQGEEARQDIGSLIDKLTELLRQYASGSKAARDELKRKFGKKLISLDSILAVLILGSKERESELSMRQEVVND